MPSSSLHTYISYQFVHVKAIQIPQIPLVLYVWQLVSLQQRWKFNGRSGQTQTTATNGFFNSLCQCPVDAALSYSVFENELLRDLVAYCNADLTVLCGTTVSREVLKMKSAYGPQIADKLSDIPGAVSLTTEEWSFRMYRGYLAVTIHWIDKY